MSHETFQPPELEHLAEVLPNFDFEAFIAKGGMGAVYKAKQRSLDRPVAIKILPRELGSDPEFRASFETEAKAMARLNHPNLISVYDYGDVEGMPYIVMEYVDGKSLYYSAWNKQIEPSQAVQLVAGICRGLGHAHENGVLHRDIKPANILLTPKAEPKIGDFGLALSTDQVGSGLVMGTPGYAAPEFLQDHEKADKRADIFAVGVILHELVTGQRPDPEGKEKRRSTNNPKLDAIVRKATQPNPLHRFATAEAMADALDDWLRSPGPNTAGPPPPRSETAAAPAQSAKPAPKALAAGPAAKPAEKPGAEAQEQPQLATSGSNWGIIRNLLIIAVLLVAIGFTYKLLKETRDKNAKENARIEKENFEDDQRRLAEQKAAEEQARRRAEQRAAELAAEAANRPEPEPEPEKETPLEMLTRLRTDLANGEREEMPEGTLRQGDRYFFLADKPLGWHQAAQFAENHGGHLAIIATDDDITWLTELVPDDTSVWVGAGRSERDKWVLIDGSDLELEKEPAGAGQYAALNDLGLVRARPGTERFPFIIEWRRDGSNPATLAAMLRRTRETLETPNPVFPPGTESQDARHFVIIPRQLDRREAEQLARQAGGTLAVPASRVEASWLASRVEDVEGPDGFWLGGTRSAEVWGWDTGEAWEYANWSPQADPAKGGKGMVLLPDGTWGDLEPSKEASGFVIEWSTDARGAELDPEEMEAAGTPGLAELREKAAELVKQATEERDDKLTANVRTFNWDLDVWFRGLNHGDRDTWDSHVEGLKAMVNDKRVPSPDQFGGDSKVRLSPQMGKVCTYCHTKQQEIDQAYLAKVERIRDFYAERLEALATEAGDQGQRALAQTIRRALEESGDLEAWIDSLDL